MCAIALALLAGSQFVIVLDTSIVNMALPSLAADLDLSAAHLSWVVNGYTVAFGGLLLLGGRLADVLGPPRTFLAGLVLFGSASLAGGLAPGPELLILARIAQGLGGALLSPAALAMLTLLHPDGAARNRALAVWGAASGAGAPAGAILGGVLTESLGWASVLLVNAPLCVLAAAWTKRLLPALAPAAAGRPFDFMGAATATGGLTLLVYALVDANRVGWASPQTCALVAGAACLLVAFVAVEARAGDPLVPMPVLGAGSLGSAGLVALAAGLPQYGMAFCLTLYVQRVLGYGPFEAGLAFLPFGAVAVFAARAASPLVTALGFKPVLVIGLTLQALGFAPLLSLAAAGTYATRVLPALVLLAAGVSLSLVAVTVAALSGMPRRHAGLAGGVIATAPVIGAALGLALTVAVYEAAAAGSDMLAGLRAAFAADAIAAVGAVVAASVAISGRQSRRHAGIK